MSSLDLHGVVNYTYEQFIISGQLYGLQGNYISCHEAIQVAVILNSIVSTFIFSMYVRCMCIHLSLTSDHVHGHVCLCLYIL